MSWFSNLIPSGTAPALLRSGARAADWGANQLRPRNDVTGGTGPMNPLTSVQNSVSNSLYGGANNLRGKANNISTLTDYAARPKYDAGAAQQAADETYFNGQGPTQPTDFEKEAWNLANANGEPANWKNYIGRAQQNVADRNYQNGVRDNVAQFIAELGKPVDMNDEWTQRALSNAMAGAQNSARLRGISGGLANLNSSKAFADASLGIAKSREDTNNALITQLRGLQFGDINSARNAANQANSIYGQRANYLTGLNNENTIANNQAIYSQGLAQNNAIGGIGGAFLGAIPGIAMGNPQVAVSGAQAGANFGGVAMNGFNSVAPPSNPTYGNYGRGSGGGGSGLNNLRY